MQPDSDAAALCHFICMTQQPEAGDIRAGVNMLQSRHGFRCRLVQGGHMGIGSLHVFLFHQIRLGSRAQHAAAQGLGQHQHISGLSADVLENPVRVNKTGYAQAVLGFVILNGMSPGNETAGFHGFVVAPLQNLAYRCERKAAGHTQQVHGQSGPAAHGIYVAERVGCGDLAEGIGIIHDRSEKVDRLNKGGIFIDFVYTGVIAAFIANQQVFIKDIGQTCKYFTEDSRSQLGRSPG